MPTDQLMYYTLLKQRNTHTIIRLMWIPGHVRELSNYASSARYLACCFNYRHLAEQVHFWLRSMPTIRLVNLQFSRRNAIANCYSDKKYIGDFADMVLNGTLLASVHGAKLTQVFGPFFEFLYKEGNVNAVSLVLD